MYWRGDEGRTWYLASYNELDSGLVLKICGSASNKNFEPEEGSVDSNLVTLSKPMDYKIVELKKAGNIVDLGDGHPLKTGSVCGKILISNTNTNIESLVEGSEPEVVLLCANKIKPDRYPIAGKYKFRQIIKTKSESPGGDGPSPCVILSSLNE